MNKSLNMEKESERQEGDQYCNASMQATVQNDSKSVGYESVQIEPICFQQALHELQALDFVLVELTLYLDTHPQDAEAIKQYNQASYERAGKAAHFERCFGPLQSYGRSFTRYPWQWNESPWPWQV